MPTSTEVPPYSILPFFTNTFAPPPSRTPTYVVRELLQTLSSVPHQQEQPLEQDEQYADLNVDMSCDDLPQDSEQDQGVADLARRLLLVLDDPGDEDEDEQDVELDLDDSSNDGLEPDTHYLSNSKYNPTTTFQVLILRRCVVSSCPVSGSPRW